MMKCPFQLKKEKRMCIKATILAKCWDAASIQAMMKSFLILPSSAFIMTLLSPTERDTGYIYAVECAAILSDSILIPRSYHYLFLHFRSI
jgi:hypothetical protein